MKPLQEQMTPVQGDRIDKFISFYFRKKVPNQQAVVNYLVEFSEKTNVRFTPKSLAYLMGEMRNKEQMRGLSQKNVINALDSILVEFMENFRHQELIGQRTIKEIVSKIGCPKPWC